MQNDDRNIEPVHYRITMASFLDRTFALTGLLPEERESHGMLRLKNKMLWYGVLLELPEPSRAALGQFERLTAGKSVSADITRAALQAGAFLEGDKAFDWFVFRLENASSEQERQNILRAMGCFSNADIVEKAKAYTVTEVPQRNMHLPVAWMAMNPLAKDTLWDWFTENRKMLEKIHPILFERIIAAITPVSCLEPRGEIRESLESLAEEKPLLAPAVRMSLAKRAVNQRLRMATG